MTAGPHDGKSATTGLSEAERRTAAREFAQTWAGKGYEKGDTATFWLELLRTVVGMRDVSTDVRFEPRTAAGGFIDVVIPKAKTIVEQKSLGVDLDKPELRQGVMVTPFEQAKRYADALPNSQRPDFIIVCNFETFRVHNLDTEKPSEKYLEFTLQELPGQFHLLDFLTDASLSREEKEKRVSIKAGELIGRLHRALLNQYMDPDSPETWHHLNMLCVRLVFCLYAEDSGLFAKDAFLRYLRSFSAAHMRGALRDLFEVLDQAPEDRDPYLGDDLAVFPYVNGGLFSEPCQIPQFTEELRELLLGPVARDTDWSQISPTVFGGVFESTLNPEARRAGGMHYTSPENIHKVIDPLFLDGLKAELAAILENKTLGAIARRNRLQKFQDRLGSLTFFDPACGSGNFLTETYIELRRLENTVLTELARGQVSFEFEGVGESLVKVSLDQFHGIEINDFAVNVARTALWIAELQANVETEVILQREVEALPLRDSVTIAEGNALRMDWNDVVPAEKCDYILGNPPFIGYSNHSEQQKEDRARIFGKKGGRLDYVAGWYRLAAEYMRGTGIRAAFVSTNSICQGQQVAPLWKPLFDDGITIDFAWRTFVWANEGTNPAHVHVVIVGFSYVDAPAKTLYTTGRGGDVTEEQVPVINAYLTPAAEAFIPTRRAPLCDAPAMIAGGKPTEGGNLLLWEDEMRELVAAEPDAARWIRRFSMGAEFINGKRRYCIWLKDCPPHELAAMPLVRQRVENVREMRLNSTKAVTREKAATPWLFDEIRYDGDGTYIGVPAVSSERRKCIPIGFVEDGMIPGNKLYFVPTDSRYIFGVLMSRVHNAWMRYVGGRLKSDYNYANTIVYNNLVWPEVTDSQRRSIESCAQQVLDARSGYMFPEGRETSAGEDGVLGPVEPAPMVTLADLYDPENEWLYPELTAAHAALDAAVEEAYGLTPGVAEKDIVAHLFNLYAEATR